MAGPTVKEILFKWGIDNSNWKKAITELSALLVKANADSAKAQDQAAKKLDAQKQKLKELVADYKSETSEIEKQIARLKVKAAASAATKADASARLVTEKLASVEAEKQASLQKTLQASQKTLQAEINTKLLQERLVTAEINKQNAALRLQVSQQRAAGGGAGAGGKGGGQQGGGGFLGGLFGSFGSKFGGTLTSGVAMGELLAHTIEDLTQKVKNFIESSGPLEQVREQFEKLTKLKGIDAVKFLEDMRKSTHNLVADVELYRTANKFMQSGVSASEEQIAKLTAATVGLARAQGVDATRALESLTRGLTTGRFMQLGFLTGINRMQLQVQGLTATMSDHVRMQKQFDKAYQVITGRFQQVGEPAITLTEKLKQLQVTTDRAFEAFSRGVVQSRGVQEVFKFLDDSIGGLTSREGGLESLGQKLADGFVPFVEVLKTVKSVLVEIISLFSTMASQIPGTGAAFSTFSGFMKTLAGAVILIKYTILDVVTALQKEVAILSFNKIGNVAEIDKKRAALGQQEYDEYLGLETKFAAPQQKVNLGPSAQDKADQEQENIALQRQLRQLALKGKELDAQVELSIEKGKLEKLKQANEEAYNAGLEDLEKYISRKKVLRNLELQDTIKELEQEKAAKLQELKDRSTTEFMAPEAYKKSVENIQKETAKKEIDARNAAQRDIDALDIREANDKIAARRKLTDALEALDKEQTAREREATEYAFQQGEIGAQEYLDKKIKYIEQDYEAVKTAEEKKLEENKTSETARAEFSAKMAKASEDREKALTKLSLDEIEIRTKALEQSYDRAQKLIDSQIKYQQDISKNTYFGGGQGDERSLIEAQIALLKSRLEQEVKALELTDKGTAAWFQQYEKIQATKDALVKYNEELAKSYNLSEGAASAIREMAGAAGKFPKGGRVASGLETLAGGIEEQARARQRIAQRQAAAAAKAAGKTAAPVTPEEIFASLQKVSKEAGADLGKHLKDASASVEEWRKNLVDSSSQMDASIDRTTKALIDLAAQVDKTTGSFQGKPGGGGGPSGQSTAGSPLGTTTASDLETMQPDWLTSMISAGPGGGQIGGASSEAATGLTQVAQSAKSLDSNFKSILDTTVGNDGLIGYFKNLGKDTQSASDDLSNFADSISSIAGNIGGLISAGKGTGGPFQAGMQGMQAGMGLGGDIGGMFGPMGQMIGAGVGAGVGLVMGVFSGKAKKEAEKIAKDITAQFNAVLTEVQQGTLGLGSAVTQEIQIIQDAVSQLSGKKGGRDELKQMLPQMEQQLAQLQAQQQQIIKSFDKQLEIASAPEAAQALVQPIQQIIDTYQQYVLAGGNVQLANQYLQDSFRNLVEQGLDQLNSAEQDAVNNALNYNDLLLQRQELIQNTNQQIQDIMSQGVAVRQMPEGVTKARELQQVMLNAQNQQAQLDEQIAVSQHKLQNEQKIFNLATTRVGLETQLVQLQDAQIDKQDASTTALLGEVAAFSQATPTNLPSALGMIGLGSSYVSPGEEPGLMPIPPVPTGIQWIDEQNQLQYQQALAYYNQQAGLSSSSMIGALPLTGVPGGTMGVTVAGAGSAATTTSATTLGWALDSLASNIATLITGLQQIFGISTSGGTAIPTGTGLSATNDLKLAAVGSIQASTDSLVSAAQQRNVIEGNISDLSTTRVQNETQLVTLKMQEISSDMIRLKAWQDFMDTPSSPGTQGQTLEDLLQNVYQTRARQGYGGFNGEIANPLS